jgi:hypothetical protein
VAMTQELAHHIKHELTINGLSNAFFNGLIAWLLIKDKGLLDWWGDHSFAVDILATAFILPFIVTLIVIPMQRRKARLGKVAAFHPDPSRIVENWIIRLPDNLMLNATLFGLAGMLLIAPLILMGIYLAGVDSFTALQYSLFKGLWTGMMASILVVPMILVGLRKTP